MLSKHKGFISFSFFFFSDKKNYPRSNSNKSHTTETVTRPSRTTVQDISPDAEIYSYYKHLPEIVGRVKNLKSLNAWNTIILETKLILQKPSECYNTTLSELTITLDDGLGFTIQVYDCYIPEYHTI